MEMEISARSDMCRDEEENVRAEASCEAFNIHFREIKSDESDWKFGQL